LAPENIRGGPHDHRFGVANHAYGLTGPLETLTAGSVDAALLVNVGATLLRQ
jgi:hypothetical protein